MKDQETINKIIAWKNQLHDMYTNGLISTEDYERLIVLCDKAEKSVEDE